MAKVGSIAMVDTGHIVDITVIDPLEILAPHCYERTMLKMH